MPDTCEAFKNFLSRLRTGLPRLTESAEREALVQSPQFNPFAAIGIQGKEDILHTPILAFLLDPAAEHGQRHLFLRHFFDMLRRHGIAPPGAPLEVGEWAIGTQVGVGRFGRLDVSIENAKQRYVVVIENKVGIDDHDDQLGKYRNWMEVWRQDFQRHLLYLTPGGKLPTGADGGCLCLSYKVDVIDFLKTALDDVRSRPVREFVSHYIALWQDDGELGMTGFSADVRRFCLDAENVPHVLDVLKQGQHIRQALLREFWGGLESYLEKTSPAELRSVLSAMEWSADQSTPRAQSDWAGRYLCATDLSQEQHLSYFIEHWGTGERFEVAYGICWEIAADDSCRQSGTAVRKLCKQLKKLDFRMDDPNEYLGYRTDFNKDDSVYSFLRRFVDDGEVLYRQIAKQFWFLVSETHEWFQQANIEVTTARRR